MVLPAALAGEGAAPGLVVDGGGGCHLLRGVGEHDAPEVLPVARPGAQRLQEAERLLGDAAVESEDDQVDVGLAAVLAPLARERDLGVVGAWCQA